MIGFITCGKSKRPERCKAREGINSYYDSKKRRLF